MKTTKTGVAEWAEHSVNIQTGCEHNCRYCFARHNAVVRFKQCDAAQWTKPVIDQTKVDRRYHGRYKGVVMFPTAHDITPLNLSEYLCVLRKLLDAGNNILIVTKPHWPCITVICEAYANFKKQMTFRFTIGSTGDAVLKFWEPGAPGFMERLSCLRYAYYRGYSTSVSCEPYLDPHVIYTYTACKPYITDSFWVGKLRHFNSRVQLYGVTEEQMKQFVEPLKAAQCDKVVRDIYKLLDGQPFIQWKDSIREVMGI
jgi:hypothetical protein